MGNGCQTQHIPHKVISNLYECKIWSNNNNSNENNNNSYIYPEYIELLSSSLPSSSTTTSSLPSTLFPTSIFLQKEDIGIALSGGGFRAVTLSLGILRGLYLLGLLSKVKYISTNSGSGWVVTPLCYYNGDIKVFLDPYLPPNQCTKQNLKKCNPNGHSYAICKSKELEIFLKELIDGIVRRNQADTRGFWSQAVGQIFFKKYNLNFYDYLPAISGHHQQDIITRTSFPSSKILSCDLNKLPFPIINGCVVTKNNELFAPVEFTPLYYGFPSKFKLHENDSHESGGYYIEPYGFTSIPSSNIVDEIKQQISLESSNLRSSPHDHIVLNEVHNNNNNNNNNTNNNNNNHNHNNLQTLSQHILCRIPKPTKLISISDCAGISSSAHTQLLAHDLNPKSANMLDLSVYPIWNPITGHINSTIFCDGGGVDNTGIHALIRRKIKKIIFMFALDAPFMDPRIDHTNLSQSNFACVAGLFGVMKIDSKHTPDNLTAKNYNKLHQIFPSEDYQKCINLLKERYLNGKPCTCIFQTTVISNSYVNIIGGFNVEILFIINAPSDDWVNQLPNSTRKKVLKQRKEVDKHLNLLNKLNKEETENNNDEKDDEKDNEDDENNDNEESKLYEQATVKMKEVKDFIEQIPNRFEDDADKLNQFITEMFQDSSLDSFPYIPLSKLDYSIELVNLLSNLMCWEVLESKDLFETLCGHEVHLNQEF